MAFFSRLIDKIFPDSEKDTLAQLAKEASQPPYYVVPTEWILGWMAYQDGRGEHPGQIQFDSLVNDETSKNQLKFRKDFYLLNK